MQWGAISSISSNKLWFVGLRDQRGYSRGLQGGGTAWTACIYVQGYHGGAAVSEMPVIGNIEVEGGKGEIVLGPWQ